MRIRRIPSKGLVLSRLPAAQLRLLTQIPVHADPSGSPGAEDRLYQSPVRTPLDDTEDELVGDWNDHVLPDLRSEFARQLECVQADLRTARREPPPRRSNPAALQEEPPWDGTGNDQKPLGDADEEEEDDPDTGPPQPESPPDSVAAETYALIIPHHHVESWFGALNQARLVMQARYNFPELETLESIVALLASENLKPYLTSRFYTEMQGALLELGMDVEEEP